MAALQVTFSAGQGQRVFALEPNVNSVTIGRGTEAELYVNSPRLSRRHCEVKLSERGVEVQDLGSSNGTFLNGHKVDRALVRPGDVVQVGGIAIRIDYEPQAAKVSDRCESCGRGISMSTIDDGDVLELTDRMLCPACAEQNRLTKTTDAEQRLMERLAEEGYTVEEKIAALSSPVVPVFKARRAGLDNIVSIKALPLLTGVPKKKIERFQAEAKTAAKVKHPVVIQIYDIRRLPDLLYIVMEHVEGETLLERIERTGRLPPRDALRIGLLIAKALEVAQKQGIVHRDIKPANILITHDDGSPKLVDFGIAKDLWQLTGGLTGPEETLGTVRYMPPEQVKNAREADHRADMYSLAATVFHAISGKPPYPDRTDLDLMRQVVGGTLAAFDPRGHEGVHPAVADVLARALQQSPADRYATPTEFREALAQAITTMAGLPHFKGDPELLLSLRQPLDQTWSIRAPAPPKPGGMSGAFEGDQLVEFVQMIGVNSKTGVLKVTASERGGHLAFREGRVIAARTTDNLREQEACFVILSFRSGEFEFRPDLPANVKTEHQLPVEGLLLEALRRRDESQG
jgi:serine/threonine protein kinase